MNTYIPKVGDSVVARRKIKEKSLANTICGPVVSSYEDSCRILTNEGTDIEFDFKLDYNDWNFQYLHKTSESIVNYIVTIKDFRGTKIIECNTSEQVWKAIGNSTLGSLYEVESPTGKDVAGFIPF